MLRFLLQNVILKKDRPLRLRLVFAELDPTSHSGRQLGGVHQADHVATELALGSRR